LGLWRPVALAAALVLALTANSGSWTPTAACGAGSDCLASPSSATEQAGDTVALLGPFDETADDDPFELADDPPLAEPSVISQPPSSHTVILDRTLALRPPHRHRLPAKTGPPHV
jgi:hypothetical protein